MSGRLVVVSIDTEVDKDARWHISSPPTFRSLTEAVPAVFTPLFERHGAVPTYLLSPEVIEDAASADTLAALGDRAELGTHLHPQLVGPSRQLEPATMAGQTADDIQCTLSRELEQAKMAALTDLFTSTFGARPTAFRAGRYGSGRHTLELLAGLGYVVDSSVTPGLRWRYAEGEVDHRDWGVDATVVQTPAGPIVELPLSIRPGGTLARLLRDAPERVRAAAGRLVGPSATYQWLRPSWGRPEDLVRYVETAEERVLVVMLHSIEVVAGASPYARDDSDVAEVVRRLDAILAACVRAGDHFVGMTEAARAITP